MATLPPKYPSGCTDAVIEQTIAEITKDISATQGDINVVLQLVPLQAIGLIELQSEPPRVLRRARYVSV